jgi:Fe-S-cluster containining protein
VEQGFIHTRHLYTLRKGELAKDPVQGGLVCIENDIIKIKGRGTMWACCFFAEDSHICRIYENRPQECRQLECWNTSGLKHMYDRDRLSRRDLLISVEGLWGLIEDHERRCGYGRIRSLLEQMDGSGAPMVRREIEQITQYDGELRKLMVAQGGLEPDMLDFLLGRPLLETLPFFQRQVAPAGQIRKRSGG